MSITTCMAGIGDSLTKWNAEYITTCSRGNRMPTHQVLIIDDDPAIRDVFCRLLAKERFRSTSSDSASEASRKLNLGKFHLILLDVALPGIGGIDFCKALRADPRTASIPLILMSARFPRDVMQHLSETLKVPIYDKHAVLAELVSLIRGILSRPDALQNRGLLLDHIHETVEISGHRLPALSHRCFRLFCALADHSGPMKREEILSRVWPNGDNVSLVDVTIHRLRRSLVACPNVRIDATGGGYQLVLR